MCGLTTAGGRDSIAIMRNLFYFVLLISFSIQELELLDKSLQRFTRLTGLFFCNKFHEKIIPVHDVFKRPLILNLNLRSMAAFMQHPIMNIEKYFVSKFELLVALATPNTFNYSHHLFRIASQRSLSFSHSLPAVFVFPKIR